MHKDPRQKHFLRIKGKIRGIYVVKILHICRIIFIFYAFSGRENCSRSAQPLLGGWRIIWYLLLRWQVL